MRAPVLVRELAREQGQVLERFLAPARAPEPVREPVLSLELAPARQWVRVPVSKRLRES
ncbi:MAG: hypothetical protein ACR2JR_05405 [Rubrobacteraceae bacterium]